MNLRSWRARILLGVLAVTLILSVAAGGNGDGGDEPALAAGSTPPRRAPSEVRALPRIELERLHGDAAADARASVVNPFLPTSWYVPPPPPPKAPVQASSPPKPTAPPMPFAFMGLYEEDGVLTILLVRDERIYAVSEGEVIDNSYRVERLRGGVLELTYLPLNIKQTIGAGGA